MNTKSKDITIHIDVTDRRAIYQEAPKALVCGNPFNIVFTFDEEWDAYANTPKKAKLVFWHRGKLESITKEFTGSTCSFSALFGITNLEVGVYIDGDICTTTGAQIPCEKSIRCCNAKTVTGMFGSSDGLGDSIEGITGGTAVTVDGKKVDIFPADTYIGGRIVAALAEINTEATTIMTDGEKLKTFDIDAYISKVSQNILDTVGLMLHGGNNEFYMELVDEFNTVEDTSENITSAGFKGEVGVTEVCTNVSLAQACPELQSGGAYIIRYEVTGNCSLCLYDDGGKLYYRFNSGEMFLVTDQMLTAKLRVVSADATEAWSITNIGVYLSTDEGLNMYSGLAQVFIKEFARLRHQMDADKIHLNERLVALTEYFADENTKQDEVLAAFRETVNKTNEEQDKQLQTLLEAIQALGKADETIRGDFVKAIAEAVKESKDHTDQRFDTILGEGGTDTLDTLAEIAKALGDDPNFATTILTELGKKANKTVGVNHILGTDANGKDILLTYAQSAGSKTIPIRTPYGQVRTKAAVNDEDAVNLAQMNAALSDKASAKSVETLIKKVANIEAGTAEDAFIVDNSTDYEKFVPTDVASYAEIREIGGMTYLAEGMPADISVLVCDDDGYEIGIDEENEQVRVGVDPIQRYYDTSAPFSEIFKYVEVGKTYAITYDVRGETGGGMYIGTLYAVKQPFVLTEAIYNSRITFYNESIDTEAGLYAASAYFSNIKLSEIGGSTRYVKATRVESVDMYGNVIATLHIPAEVQALEGYGSTGYRIVWDEDSGKAYWVTPGQNRTDISAYFTDDNILLIKEGGIIRLDNPEGLAAPSTIIYRKRGF